jgi:MBG domain/Immunoglobulin I-set domain/PKD domain/Immunoglobulin domain/NHL repeat
LQCALVLGLGAGSASAQTGPPGISSQPRSVTNAFGGTAQLTVVATSTVQGYQWQRNGTNLTDVGNVSGSGTATLTLTNLSTSDAASYDVILANAFGSTTSAVAVLTVFLPPVVVIGTVGACSGPPGLSVIFTSAGTYDPQGAPLTGAWSFGNGTKQAWTSGIEAFPYYSSAGVYQASLTISNAVSATTSTNLTITVTSSAFIGKPPASLVVAPGYTAILTATVSGAGQLWYQWYKNGASVGAPATGGTSVSLTLTNLDATAAGSYTVVVTNAINMATSSPPAVLTVEPALAIFTFAGQPGISGTSDGFGTNAQFGFPSGLAVDGAGNVYVPDIANTIRKITPAGVVSTLAGMAWVSGTNDGPGSSARFNLPDRLAVDANGNVYVGDSGNNTIRKITPAGVVSTLAGMPGVAGSKDGIGSAARFSGPEGVAVDTAGNVYVGDSGNGTIRKVTPAGAVSTLAGTPGLHGTSDGVGGAARFAYPNGVAVDTAGNLYVADGTGSPPTPNNAIRRITPAGVVTTLAGSSASGETDGIGGSARFNNPDSVAVDSAGNIYVAEFNGETIRKITPAGIVDTLAGRWRSGTNDGTGTAARFYYPNGVAVDAAGNLYVGDRQNYTVRKGVPDYGQPIITTQPQSLTNVAGSTAAFSALVGNSPQAFQWQFNGVNLTDGDGISGSQTSSLTVSNAFVANAGSYWLVATNTSGSATSVVALLSVTQTKATVTLANLAQAYDGTPKPVSVTTVPPGLALTVTYNGAFNAPTNPGSYTVVATVTDPYYQGCTTNTLVISSPLVGAWRDSSGQFEFTLTTAPGFDYTILVSSNLQTWEPAWDFHGSGGPVTIPDPGAVSCPQRYYRVLIGP